MHGEVSRSHQSEHEGIFTGGRDRHEALWGEKKQLSESLPQYWDSLKCTE